MELPLVAGVDGSEPSLRAVDWAVAEAARHGLPLRLVYASLWERYEGGAPSEGPDRPTDRAPADTLVTTAAERARRCDPDVKVSVDVIPDEAVKTVAARAHGPVIVVRGDKAGLKGSHGRILLGAADPAIAGEAARFAFREAEVRRCTLDAVRAWRTRAYDTADLPLITGEPAHYQEERASALLDAVLHDPMADHPGVPVSRATVEGPACRVLLHRSAAADLVVLGARRPSGHFGLQLGRVQHALLHHAACTVAVVPQPE